MIEINLLPGAQKRAVRRASRRALALPRLRSLPKVDRMLAAIVVFWLLGPTVIGYRYLTAKRRVDELNRSIAQAVEDSARYDNLIRTTRALQARRDTIAQKLQIIQEIDAGRYIWSHILDELSRTLPDYTWLVSVAETQAGTVPGFQINGQTGNTFALAQFMNDLEASPFIRSVRLASTERITTAGRPVMSFLIDASYEEPPADILETVPLFAPEELEGAAPAAPDSVAGSPADMSRRVAPDTGRGRRVGEDR